MTFHRFQQSKLFGIAGNCQKAIAKVSENKIQALKPQTCHLRWNETPGLLSEKSDQNIHRVSEAVSFLIVP
jgi:hypothetical protein